MSEFRITKTMRYYFIILFILLGFKIAPQKKTNQIFFVYDIEAYLSDSFLDKFSFSYMQKENLFLLDLINKEKIEKLEFRIDYSSLSGINNYLKNGDSLDFEYDLHFKYRKYILNKIKFFVSNKCDVSFYTDSLDFNISNYARSLLFEYFIPLDSIKFKKNIESSSIIELKNKVLTNKGFSNKKYDIQIDRLIKILTQLTHKKSFSTHRVKVFFANYNNELNSYIETIKANKGDLNLKLGLAKIVNCLSNEHSKKNYLDNYFKYIEGRINSIEDKKTLYVIDNNIYESPYYKLTIKSILKNSSNQYEVYKILNNPIDEYFSDAYLERRNLKRQIKDSIIVGAEHIFTFR